MKNATAGGGSAGIKPGGNCGEPIETAGPAADQKRPHPQRRQVNRARIKRTPLRLTPIARARELASYSAENETPSQSLLRPPVNQTGTAPGSGGGGSRHPAVPCDAPASQPAADLHPSRSVGVVRCCLTARSAATMTHFA